MTETERREDTTEKATDRQSLPTLRKQILENRLAIFAILFTVTGFLGLPLLWKSPVFTTTEKWLWSIVVTAYTLLLILVAVAIVWWAWLRVRPLLYY